MILFDSHKLVKINKIRIRVYRKIFMKSFTVIIEDIAAIVIKLFTKSFIDYRFICSSKKIEFKRIAI